MEARKSSKNLNSIEIVMKVLGSLFCFALILMFSTSLLPCIVRIMQLFTSNLSKSYIFLLCNGILVFIVKNSGSVSDSNEDKLMNSSGVSSEKLELLAEMKLEVAKEEVVVMEIKEVELTQDETVVMVEQEQEEEEQEEEEEEEQDDDDDYDEEMSREELNKKCEDFIRKMKQNIKLESQQLRCYYA